MCSTLSIGSLDVSPPIALAPMVGLSHSALRLLLLDFGGVGLFFSEMLAAKHLPYDDPSSSPMLARDGREKPLFYQVYVADPAHVRDGVIKLESLSADGIDLNLGCPAPQVRRKGAGGFLAEQHDLTRDIIQSLRKNTSLPLTAKIRIGRELNKQRLVDLCTMLEGEGVDMISVHARLHGEKFCRPPRWQWIAHAKASVTIPVIANGGIFSVDDARKCLDVTGADGLMLGRGGVEKPWLFSLIAKEIYGVKTPDTERSMPEMYFRFIDLLEAQFKKERRLGRLKQFTPYFSKNYKFGHQLATIIQRCRSIDEARDKADLFFQKNRS